MDWLHCNNCYSLPSACTGFCFSSCGHIICIKCLDQVGTPNTRSLCRVCKKPASFSRIDRALKPELQNYFRVPKEVASEYAQNLKSVLDFQSHHRSRLYKFQQEKCQKAIAYAKGAQAEISKRKENERAVLAETDHLKMELEKQTANAENLENILYEKELEIQKLRNTRTSPFARKSDKTYPSLNGATPINSLSFRGACATSTPLGNMQNIFGDEPHFNTGSRTNVLDTPAAYESPIAGNFFSADNCNTPALLGLPQRKRSISAPRASGGEHGMGTFF